MSKLEFAGIIPPIGFGTWRLPEGKETAQIVKNAIDTGFKHIDTASSYNSEQEVGEGIKASGIKRSDIFISGKLWNEDRSFTKAVAACKKSLTNVQTDYFDLYMIHWPASKAVHDNWQEINAEAWAALEEIQKQGLAKNIGVSNFKAHHLQNLIKNATEMPFVNQIEYHPGQTEKETVDFCRKKNIIVEAWGPLGNGKMLRNPTLIQIAEKYDMTAAQLCIAWCIQNKVLPIVKTKTEARMEENLAATELYISEEDLQAINSMEFFAGSRLDSDTITIFN